MSSFCMEPLALRDHPLRTDSDIAAAHGATLDWLLGRINYERVPCLPYSAGRLKLERMRELLARLGNPQQRMRLIHVGGTKGKGSTAAAIAAILTAAGYRTGLYSSPHLDRIEERWAVDGRCCSAAEFVALIARIRPVVEAMEGQGRAADLQRDHSERVLQSGPQAELGRGDGPTYFEITTALAFLHFADRQVDAAVIEVGLGGRLDSTNVIAPVVAVISSVSLDHTKQLGSTLTDIAREKAGIFKRGVSVVSGVTEAEPRRVICQTAQRLDCRLLEASVDFSFRYAPPARIDVPQPSGTIDFECRATGLEHRYSGLELSLLGHHQAANAAVALAVVGELRRQGWAVSEGAVRGGLAAAALPARVEVVGRRPSVIIDSAHNVASAEALVRVLTDSAVPRPRILVFAASRDKDVRGMLQVLGPEFDRVILTRYAQNQRAAAVGQLSAMARELTSAPCHAVERSADAWQAACRHAGREGLIVVTGSFFLAAEVRRLATSRRPREAALSSLDPV